MVQNYSRKPSNGQYSFNLHHILRDYHQQQNQKICLLNRINMFKMNQSKNEKRALYLSKQLKKMNKAKRQYKQEKEQIIKKLQQRRRIIEEKKMKVQKIKKDKQNLLSVKSQINKVKKKKYHNTKQNSILNQIKISKNKQEQYKKNRISSFIVRQYQQQHKSKIQSFYQNKLDCIKNKHKRYIQNIYLTDQKKILQLKELRSLQNQMMAKFSQSMKSIKSQSISDLNKDY